MEELMRCPFCGDAEPQRYEGYVKCWNCGATGPDDEDAWGTKSDQTHLTPELWNRRASAPTPNAQADRIGGP